MLFLFGRAIQLGARSALLVRTAEHAAIVVAAASTYVVMFLVFAYVDIAWDVRSTVFLGGGVRAVRRLRAGHRQRPPTTPAPAHFEMVPR